MKKEGFPCIEDPTRAIIAMSALMFFGEKFNLNEAKQDFKKNDFVIKIPEKKLNEIDCSEILRAANFTKLKIDKFFVGSHGLIDTGDIHSEQPYKVVGILKKTGTILDNLIITSLDSVWNLHSNQNDILKNSDSLEVTALLLKYKNKTSVFSFPRLINKHKYAGS